MHAYGAKAILMAEGSDSTRFAARFDPASVAALIRHLFALSDLCRIYRSVPWSCRTTSHLDSFPALNCLPLVRTIYGQNSLDIFRMTTFLTAMPAYQHRDLDPFKGEIQILKFLPQPNDLESLALSCTLEHVYLDVSYSSRSVVGSGVAAHHLAYDSSYYGNVRHGRGLRITPRFFWVDFESKSYCWGSMERDKIIRMDGSFAQVAASLETMLRHLQHLTEAQAGLKFWIDSLCINQANDPKKKSNK